MKKIYCLLFLINNVVFAQIPTGYYNTATATGFELKTQLYNIINPHTTIVFGSGLWNLFTASDDRPDGYVWKIYSNCNLFLEPLPMVEIKMMVL